MLDGSTACTCCLLSVLQYVYRASRRTFLSCLLKRFSRNIISDSRPFPPPASFCLLDTAEADSCSVELLSSPVWKQSSVLMVIWMGSGVRGVIPQLFSVLRFQFVTLPSEVVFEEGSDLDADTVCTLNALQMLNLMTFFAAKFVFLITVAICPSC